MANGRNKDTPEATAPAPPISGLTTEVAVAALVIFAMLALTGLRITFSGAAVQMGGS